MRIDTRRFTSPHSREECERQIWLLSGRTIPPPVPKRSLIMIFATADAEGFALWISTTSYRATSVLGPPLRLRGVWSASETGTTVTMWYEPFPWAIRWIVIPFGLGVAGIMLGAFGVDVLGMVFGAIRWLALLGLFAISLWFLGMCRSQLKRDELGRLVRERLDPEPEPFPVRRRLRRRKG